MRVRLAKEPRRDEMDMRDMPNGSIALIVSPPAYEGFIVQMIHNIRHSGDHLVFTIGGDYSQTFRNFDGVRVRLLKSGEMIEVE